jgi:Methyltransferase domain
LIKKYTYLDLEQWYETPLGRYVYAAESEWLADYLKQCFGYYLLQLGGSHSLKALHPSPIRNHIWCIPQYHNNNLETTLCCDFDELPLAENSIDTFVLPHTLDLSSNPEAVIHAAANALMPEGTMLILGFNPVGIFTPIKQVLAWSRNELPWGLKWQRIGRVRRWLEEADCEIESIKTFLFSFSSTILGSVQRRGLVEAFGQGVCPTWGGVYLIFARKHMVRLTPLEVKWHKQSLSNKAPVLPMQNKQ